MVHLVVVLYLALVFLLILEAVALVYLLFVKKATIFNSNVELHVKKKQEMSKSND